MHPITRKSEYSFHLHRNESKRMEKYQMRKVNRKVDLFFNRLSKTGIMAKRDFECCPNCGRTKMMSIEDTESDAYVFYHIQTTDQIKEQLKKMNGKEPGPKSVEFYVQWNFFDDEPKTDKEVDALAARIIHVAESVPGVIVKYAAEKKLSECLLVSVIVSSE
jgi:hypothetical protein